MNFVSQMWSAAAANCAVAKKPKQPKVKSGRTAAQLQVNAQSAADARARYEKALGGEGKTVEAIARALGITKMAAAAAMRRYEGMKLAHRAGNVGAAHNNVADIWFWGPKPETKA